MPPPGGVRYARAVRSSTTRRDSAEGDSRRAGNVAQPRIRGAWYEDGGELAWEGLSHLGTSEVGEVLERQVRRIERHLRRCGLLGIDEAEPGGEGDPKATSPLRRSRARRRRPGLSG